MLIILFAFYQRDFEIFERNAKRIYFNRRLRRYGIGRFFEFRRGLQGKVEGSLLKIRFYFMFYTNLIINFLFKNLAAFSKVSKVTD